MERELMESEIYDFIKVWLIVLLSLCYLYAINKKLPKEITITRVLCVLPIVCLFFYLPLNLHTIHLGGTTAFFIAWLANFKLLLFAFGKGPLCQNPSISLTQFVSLACLPIKIHQDPSQKPHSNSQNEQNASSKSRENPKNDDGPLSYAIKGLILALLMRVYDYSDYIHPKIILCLYCVHKYFYLELVMSVVTTLARAMLGFELEPPFNKPYLSTSLQDFWGRRWNLMVTSILRPTVYDPTVKIAARVIGGKWATVPAVLGTFLVSSIMHDLMFYYLGRARPTWEVTWFFSLHGLCVMLEVVMKKKFTARWQLPRFIAGPLTVGFVMVTAFWLYFPPFLRCKPDVRAFEEYAAFGEFVKNACGDVGRMIRRS